MSSSNSIIKGVYWTTILNVVNAVYGFISVPLLINHFGKSEYGIIGLAMSVNVYMQLMDLGFNSTNVRFFSSWLTSGLTADCTELEIGSYDDAKTKQHYDNLLYQIRPAFGGNIVATIVNPDHRPQMATVRSGVMQKAIYEGECRKEVVYPEVSKYVSPEAFVVRVLDHHVEAAKHNLKGAPIVVAGGYGVGSKEGFDQLFELAKVLHGEVGGSRAAVDAGWLDHDRQIGQTGVTVHPKVYIACGISGQIQHIAGMQDSGIIISVNSDPDAPINRIADYVIVGTVEEVVPKLIKYYKQNSK